MEGKPQRNRNSLASIWLEFATACVAESRCEPDARDLIDETEARTESTSQKPAARTMSGLPKRARR